ncbi:3-mercaptopyruvate sulfurtransferase [Sphingomonas koreensis]|nr:3-mercaptopyruvate sulfurtransferase [Sphingomonas koreensis]
MDSLVTTDWLADNLSAPDLRVLDASYFLPEHGRDAADEYRAGHIPGAAFMDLASFADQTSPLPSMTPTAEIASARLGALGIGDDTRVVVYDASPLHSAARAWWVLRLFGAHQVAILDGGLEKWRAEGRPLATDTVHPETRSFEARKDAVSVRTLDDMVANLASHSEQVIDARSPARFEGREPEARPNTAAGHIPSARNLHYATLFNADGSWKRGDALREAFTDRGVALDRPIVATCGSGITAAVLVFGGHLLGHDIALYDGSWSEWGADPTTPKATGAA